MLGEEEGERWGGGKEEGEEDKDGRKAPPVALGPASIGTASTLAQSPIFFISRG